jgi:cytochrome c oxidase subunit 3
MQTQAHIPAHPAVPVQVDDPFRGLDVRKFGMWTFLGSECLIFGSLITTALLYRGKHDPGLGPHDVLNIPFTALLAFILLLSSLTMVLALAAIQRGDRRRLQLWLLATAGLGICFLGGQAYEFSKIVHEGVTLSSSLFGASFFTLTGFHGTHVFIGVLWLLSCVARSLTGGFNERNYIGVEIAGLYWHFVDVVWVVIFTLVYLLAPTG